MNKLQLKGRITLLEVIKTRDDLNFVYESGTGGGKEGSLYNALATSSTCRLSDWEQSERLQAGGLSRWVKRTAFG